MSGTPISNVNNIHVHSMVPEDQKNMSMSRTPFSNVNNIHKTGERESPQEA